MSRRLLPLTVLACAIDVMGAGQANAQATLDGPSATKSTSVSAVVVTARRQAEALLTVPVAATVLNSETLGRYAATTLTDINDLAPQLSLERTVTGSGGQFSIRGVQSTDLDAGVEQQVSINLDGVPSSRGHILDLGLLDVDNIQVLEGPQALFYGKNSPGGVVVVTSVNPGSVPSGYLLASYGDADQAYRAEAAVTLPVNDDLSVRLAFRTTTSRGYVENEAAPQEDPFTFAPSVTGHPPVMTVPARKWGPAERGDIGRITVAWRPNDRLDVNFKYAQGYDANDGPAATSSIVACGPGQTLPVLVGGPDPTGHCTPSWTRSIAQLPAGVGIPLDPSGKPFEQTDVTVSALTATYRWHDIVFTETTGYLGYNDRNADNYDFSSLAAFFSAAQEKSTTLSQEIRAYSDFASPINFRAGVFYENASRSYDQDSKLLQVLPDPATGRWDSVNLLAKTNDVSYSAFGQVNWKILPDLELAAGARYTYELKRGDLGDTYINPVPTPADPTPLPVADRIVARVEANNVSPEVTLTWRAAKDLTVYGAFKTGFLSGGISNPGDVMVGASASSLIFRPETVSGGEAGLKGGLLNGRFDFDVTVYSYGYDNLQVTSFDATTVAFTTKNAAAARVQGVELQARFQLTGRLSLHGYLAGNDARYRSFPNGQCYTGQTATEGCVGSSQNLSGTPIGPSPAWSGDMGFTYDRPFLGDLMVGLVGDAYLASSYNITAGGAYQPGETQRAFGHVNGAVKLYRPHGPRWELALIARNLTDTKYVLTGNDTPGGAPGVVTGILAPPREVTAQLTYRF